MLIEKSPDDLNEIFRTVSVGDRERFGLPDFLSRWLFAERLKAHGQRAEMGFEAYEGPAHIRKFFHWLRHADLADFFDPEPADTLTETAYKADLRVFEHYGLPAHEDVLRKVARYNAQDHLLQRAYPVPDRNRVRRLLDFGAGHGRIANLSFNAPEPRDRLKGYLVVEAIPSTYYTQLAYFEGLGLSVWEYLDHRDDDPTPEDVARAIDSHDVVHLPTWRFDLVPDGAVDMVNCIQVLKELPGPLVPWAMAQFARVLHATGAVYIRDHLQFHNPNHMPMDQLMAAAGFVLEFAPQLYDRREIHGLPRIWRRFDPDLYLQNPNA